LSLRDITCLITALRLSKQMHHPIAVLKGAKQRKMMRIAYGIEKVIHRSKLRREKNAAGQAVMWWVEDILVEGHSQNRTMNGRARNWSWNGEITIVEIPVNFVGATEKWKSNEQTLSLAASQYFRDIQWWDIDVTKLRVLSQMIEWWFFSRIDGHSVSFSAFSETNTPPMCDHSLSSGEAALSSMVRLFGDRRPSRRSLSFHWNERPYRRAWDISRLNRLVAEC
jgi:hypothetical protein